jgi:hypothetical protein
VAHKNEPTTRTTEEECLPSGAPAYQRSIDRHLSQVKNVDAVFITTDDVGVVHVYSVVREYGDFYKKLLKQEQQIEQDYPEIDFEFHVRAHQGREPSLAVPFEAQAIFVR